MRTLLLALGLAVGGAGEATAQAVTPRVELTATPGAGNPPGTAYNFLRADNSTCAPAPTTFRLLNATPQVNPIYTDSTVFRGVPYCYYAVAVKDAEVSAPSPMISAKASLVAPGLTFRILMAGGEVRLENENGEKVASVVIPPTTITIPVEEKDLPAATEPVVEAKPVEVEVAQK